MLIFPSAYCSYSAMRFVLRSLPFLHSAFLPAFQCGKANQRFAFPFVQVSSTCSACFICTVSAFRTISSSNSSEIGIRLQGLSTAVAENLQLNEGPSCLRTHLHQFLAVATSRPCLSRDTGVCVVPGLVLPMLQHDDHLCLFKFLRGHNGGMAILNSYLLFQRSAQNPIAQGTGIMNFAPT